MPAVLVVDDDADIRELLDELLSSEGFEVLAAANGRVGLGLLERWHPAVVVLDLMMPVMSGWEFRNEQKLRVDVAGIPVIVITATTTPDVDADRILQKPFDIDTLLATVHELAGSREEARA
jgi:CheY-like chemotaxis protein